MKISKRLNTIASFIKNKSNVVDIGCDHAYLDIYLIKNKNCKCIACDINENALNNAKKNIKNYDLIDKIDNKLTDGINGINIKKTDTIVISGMGTNTIIHILSNKKLSNNIIISSNNDIEKLRLFMMSINYYIFNEKFILDNNKPYIIINFKKDNKKYSKFEYKFGPICLKDKEYLDYCIKKIKYIKSKIPNKYISRKLYLRYLIYKLKRELKKLI